eukprot:403357857
MLMCSELDQYINHGQSINNCDDNPPSFNSKLNTVELDDLRKKKQTQKKQQKSQLDDEMEELTIKNQIGSNIQEQNIINAKNTERSKSRHRNENTKNTQQNCDSQKTKLKTERQVINNKLQLNDFIQNFNLKGKDKQQQNSQREQNHKSQQAVTARDNVQSKPNPNLAQLAKITKYEPKDAVQVSRNTQNNQQKRDSIFQSRSQSSSRSSLSSTGDLNLNKLDLLQKLNEMKCCIDGYKSAKQRGVTTQKTNIQGPGPVSKVMNKSQLVKNGLFQEKKNESNLENKASQIQKTQRELESRTENQKESSQSRDRSRSKSCIRDKRNSVNHMETKRPRKVSIQIKPESDTCSSNEEEYEQINLQKSQTSDYLDVELDKKYLRESHEVSCSNISQQLQSQSFRMLNDMSKQQLMSETDLLAQQVNNQINKVNNQITLTLESEQTQGTFEVIQPKKSSSPRIKNCNSDVQAAQVSFEQQYKSIPQPQQQPNHPLVSQSLSTGMKQLEFQEPQQHQSINFQSFNQQNSIFSFKPYPELNSSNSNQNSCYQSNQIPVQQQQINQSAPYSMQHHQQQFSNINQQQYPQLNTSMCQVGNSKFLFQSNDRIGQVNNSLRIGSSQLSPTNISLAQQRQAQQINTSSDVVHEYAIMIERLQKENQEQRLKIDKKDSEISSLKENVKDLESKQTVHERIEQSLKDKIHQMQQDYYQNNREKASKIQDEELYFQNLIDLQQALVDLEKKFDSKDREVENIHRENQTLHEELQKTESKKQDLIRRIQEHEITILEQESDLNNLGQSFNTVESDCLFYKEKYQQMQVVIDGCSQQMQDFEQVNQMSCELIEKLQQELEFYKQEYETMREFMGVSGPIENEMQQTQYDKIPQRDIVGGEYEGTIRLQDYINNYNYGNIKSLEKSQFDKKQSFIRVDNMENCQNHVMLNSPSGSQFSEYVCPINFKENLLHSYQQTTRIPTASQQSPSRLETENLGQYLSPQYTDNTEYGNQERQPFSYISNYDNNPQVLSQHKIYQDFPEKENNTEMDHSSGKQQKHQNFNHDPLASDIPQWIRNNLRNSYHPKLMNRKITKIILQLIQMQTKSQQPNQKQILSDLKTNMSANWRDSDKECNKMLQ